MRQNSNRGRLAASACGLALVWGGAAVAADAAGGTAVSEVVVTAAPRKEVQARIVQQAAPNIIAVQSAETILKYPDFNAAESLGRMPGISLSSDTGEGRFVQIRGIDANLDGATFGGVPLLNTNPGGTSAGGGGRAVEFDTIPGGAIDGIIITYTGMPDHEAEGLGGSIELTPRTAANIVKPFFEGDFGWGYEPLHNHTGPVNLEGALGFRFGFDDKGPQIDGIDQPRLEPRAGFFSNPYPFSLVLEVSRKDDRRAIDDLEEGYIDQPGAAPSNSVTEYDLRRYDYHRRRFAEGGEFDFQPNDDHRWYFRISVAGYKEAVHKNFLLYTNLDSVFNNTGTVPVDPNNSNGYLVTTVPTITLTDEQETHRNTIYTIGGEDHFGGGIDLDYHAAYSRATFVVDRNIGIAFSGPTVPITYDNVSNPNYPIFTFPTGFNVNDASQYVAAPSNSNLGNNQNYDVDEEWSFAANLSFPLHILSDQDRIKIGGEARLRDKSATEIDEFYDTGTLPLTSYSGGFISSYYGGALPNGPQINLYGIRDLITTGTAPLDPSSGFNPGSYFNAWEDIYAGYVMYTGQRGPWGLVAGVRVEATDAKYGGFVFETDQLGNTTDTLQYRTVDYVNAFPTVQIKYTFTPRMLLRATWSTGIARPGFEQNTTAASIDLRTCTPCLVSRGNPNLQPTTGNNFDLSFEYYMNDGGIIQVALFDKEFHNYIAERVLNNVVDPLAPPGELSTVSTWINVNPAYARGIQLDYHQKFTFLPEPLKGFGVDGNLTLVDSRILEYDAATSQTGQNQYGLLPGTSQVTWNLAGFYEAHNLELRIAAEYVSHSLFGLGGDKSLDTIQDSRLTLDWTSSYKVTKNVSFYFDAKNLLNTPLRYYEGEPNRPLQREFYLQTYEGGVRVAF